MNEKAAARAAEEDAKGFKDVKNHWAAIPINVMLEDGILSGNGQGEFKPDDALKLPMLPLFTTSSLRNDKAQQACQSSQKQPKQKEQLKTPPLLKM